MKTIDARDIDVVILCGGLGVRFQSVISDRPKPMAEINGKPFLDILIDYTGAFGFRRFILCAGYKAEVVQAYYKNRKSEREIIVSKEDTPLGTGGAVRNAETLIHSGTFLVMNGDSFCPLDLRGFVTFHAGKKALVSIALVIAEANGEYGEITLGASQRIKKFDEKVKGRKKGLINAGIYIFDAAVLSMLPRGKKFSLEYELFPKIVDKEVYGYATDKPLIDIGTPERFRSAGQALKKAGGI